MIVVENQFDLLMIFILVWCDIELIWVWFLLIWTVNVIN